MLLFVHFSTVATCSSVNIRFAETQADRSKMASFIIKVLSVTLGLFFIFVGLLKLSPVVNKELYKEMVGSKSYGPCKVLH